MGVLSKVERNLEKLATKTGKNRKNGKKKGKLGRKWEACPCGREGLATALGPVVSIVLYCCCLLIVGGGPVVLLVVPFCSLFVVAFGCLIVVVDIPGCLSFFSSF